MCNPIDREKMVRTEGTETVYGNNIKCLEEDNHYKYLVILLAETNKHVEGRLVMNILGG